MSSNCQQPQVFGESEGNARAARWAALESREPASNGELRLPELANATRDWIRRRGWLDEAAANQLYLAIHRGKVTGSTLPILRESGHFDKDQLQELEEVERLTETIPHFQLERRLGAGAVGAVYLAEHKENQVRVALKFLHQHIDGLDEHRERFEREAAALGKLSHPVIPRLIDHSKGKQLGDLWQGRVYEQPPYLAMEYSEGMTLKDLIKEAGTVPEKYALWAMAQCAHGLRHAVETANIIHRDLKPENIIVEKPREIPVSRLWEENFPLKIIDFGLAKVAVADDKPGTDAFRQQDAAMDVEGNGDLTMVGAVLGTPRYMSPEQVMGERLDWRSDLYSLTATLFHLLTGEPPFTGGSPAEVMTKHVKSPIPDPRSILPGISDRAARICMRGLEKKAKDRYATYLDFAEACERAIQAGTTMQTGSFRSTTRVTQGTQAISRGTAPVTRAPSAPNGTAAFRPDSGVTKPSPGTGALERKSGGHRVPSDAVASTTIATERLVKSIKDKVQSDIVQRASSGDNLVVPSLDEHVRELAVRTDRILRREEGPEPSGRAPWIIVGICVLICLAVLAMRYL